MDTANNSPQPAANASRPVAEHVAQLDGVKLPADTERAFKRALLDCLTCAELAKRGLTGPEQILEVKNEVFNAQPGCALLVVAQ
jgi:2-methylcitrate dehydratase PrpD